MPNPSRRTVVVLFKPYYGELGIHNFPKGELGIHTFPKGSESKFIRTTGVRTRLVRYYIPAS